MNKKDYIAPDFKVIVLRARHCLLEGSLEENTKRAEKVDNGEYFD